MQHGKNTPVDVPCSLCNASGRLGTFAKWLTACRRLSIQLFLDGWSLRRPIAAAQERISTPLSETSSGLLEETNRACGGPILHHGDSEVHDRYSWYILPV